MKRELPAPLLGLACTLISAACTPAPPVAQALAPRATPSVAAAPAPPSPAAAPSPLPLFVQQALPDSIVKMAWSPQNLALAIHTLGGVFVADAHTGQIRSFLPGCFEESKFSPDEKSLYLSDCRSGELVLHDLEHDRVTRGREKRSGASGLEVSPSGAVVAIFDQRVLRFYDPQGGPEAIGVGYQPAGAVCGAFSPDGARFALGRSEGRLAVFSADGKTLWDSDGKQPSLAALAWSPDGSKIATAALGGLTVWDAGKGTVAFRAKPCGTFAVRDVDWSPQGGSLAVACSEQKSPWVIGPQRALLLRKDGSVKAALMESPKGLFFVDYDTAGSHVAVSNGEVGGTVFDAVTGKETARVSAACDQPGSAAICPPMAWSADLGVVARLERDSKRSQAPELTVLEVASGRALSRIAAGLPALMLGEDVGPAIWSQSRRARVTLGGAGEVVAQSDALLSPDRKRTLAQRKEGLFLTDVATGESVPAAPGPTGTIARFEWSPASTYAVALDEKAGKADGEFTLRLWDARTGKAHASFPAGKFPSVFALSADDSLLAFWVLNDVSCASPQDPKCIVVRVADTASKKVLYSIPVRDGHGDHLVFDPGGRWLAVSGAVYEARTGKLLYLADAGFIHGAVPGTSKALLIQANGIGLVDLTLGIVEKTFERASLVHDVSSDGTSFLLDGETGSALMEIKTWSVTELPKVPRGAVFVPGKSDVVAFADGPKIAYYRVADGRTLYRYGLTDPLLITDEDVFDGTDQALTKGAFRLGDDVLHSPLSALSAQKARFQHAGLLADFLAGKPVSPGPH
jgi:WD40 repeat protein